MLDTRGLNVASTKLPTIAITCVWPSRTGPGSTNCSPDSASTASSERRAKGRRARAHFTAFYYNSGTQGAQFLLYSWSFLLLPYDTVTTVGVSAVAQSAPLHTQRVFPVLAQRGASEFSPSMHQESLSKFTEHAHQAGSPKARTIRHAAASCWNVRLQPLRYHASQKVSTHNMNDMLPTPGSPLTCQAGGSQPGGTRAKRR